MSDVFISYAHSTAKQAQGAAAALRAAGYSVWLDDDLAAHRAFTHAIEEQLAAARAALVIWSADAAKSEWVLSEANRAREDHKLVQLLIDKTRLPMPFDQVQCADLAGWSGEAEHANWRKVIASIAELVGGERPSPPTPLADAALPLPSKPSIAVMPFANLSNDPEQEYFADGMVEEITTALSRIRSIFVIAAGSTLPLKGAGVSAQEAARRFGVRYVLEGSVRRSGERVRIAVKLVDAVEATQIWAERFDDTLQDVFDLQDRVALSVAGVIEPEIKDAEVRRASRRPTDNMGSYDLYLRAYCLFRETTKPDMLAALDLLERASALDPDFAMAVALQASIHRFLILYGWSDDPERQRQQSIAFAHRALSLSRDDPEVLGYAAHAIAQDERELVAATALIDRATSLNPGSAAAWAISGLLRAYAGDPDNAVEHLERSMRLSPASSLRAPQLSTLGVARFQQRRYADAATLLKEAGQLRDTPAIEAYLAASYGHLGQLDDARDALARHRAMTAMPPTTTLPRDRKAFADGIALAEGKAPSAADV
jgi:TolB-like protein/Tfp pilus assembly protein PilF